MTIKPSDLDILYGAVQYVNGVEAVPASSKTTGNVTVNNAASAGAPEHYTVSFMLNAKYENDGVASANIFHWTVPVFGLSTATSYGEIEGVAARQIAPMLRELADTVEAQILGQSPASE